MSRATNRGNDHDITVAIQNSFGRAGVRDVPAWAGMGGGVKDGLRVETGTQRLANLISSGVLTDFVDGDRVPTAMNVEGHLPTLEDRHFFRIEEVPFVGAGVGGSAYDARSRRASRSAETSDWREYTELDDGTRSRWVLMCEVALLSESHDRDRYDSGDEQGL